MLQRLGLARQLSQAARPIHDPGEPAPAVRAIVDVRVGFEQIGRWHPSQVVTGQLLRIEMA